MPATKTKIHEDYGPGYTLDQTTILTDNGFNQFTDVVTPETKSRDHTNSKTGQHYNTQFTTETPAYDYRVVANNRYDDDSATVNSVTQIQEPGGRPLTQHFRYEFDLI